MAVSQVGRSPQFIDNDTGPGSGDSATTFWTDSRLNDFLYATRYDVY
jgi:hypothetical protein